MSRKFTYFGDLRKRWNITYCRVHLRRMMVAGKFPKCVALGEGRIAWYEDEIEEWVNNRPRTEPTDEDD